MEDIIALKVSVTVNEKKFFLTWGRIFSATDEIEIIKNLKKYLPDYGISHFEKIELCESLQESSSERFFFENFFMMSQVKIPFGSKYGKWKSSMAKKIREGKEIYFLG